MAVQGVSLTIADVDVPAARFTVALIPTTLQLTTLAGLAVGDAVNIETDLVARTVVHWLQHWGDGSGTGITIDKLRDAGFTG